MSSIISFKLINEKNYDSILFYGQHLSLQELKNRILIKLGQTKITGPLKGKDRYRNKDDILVYNESRQLITDESTKIASDTKVIVERISIPLHLAGYPYEASQFSSYKETSLAKLSFKDIEEKYLNFRTRYFIIRSTCLEDIQRSIRESSWTTTNNHEIKLNNAFAKSQNVILIFSADNSSQFQGYARMKSPSTSKHTIWQPQDIYPGNAIKVTWLRVENVNFSRASHLRNKFNNHELIINSGRDTQEIPEEVGLEICRMFEYPDKENAKRSRFGSMASELSTEMFKMSVEENYDSLDDYARTRPQTDDERSQPEREPSLRYFEEMKECEVRTDLFNDVNVPHPAYFTEHGEESLQQEQSLNPEEPKVPFVPVTRPSFVKPPPPPFPLHPQGAQITSPSGRGWLTMATRNDESNNSRKKEIRNRGVKKYEWKDSGRDGRSEKERERDRERSRDKSMTKPNQTRGDSNL